MGRRRKAGRCVGLGSDRRRDKSIPQFLRSKPFGNAAVMLIADSAGPPKAARMIPLHRTRLSDLGPGDAVRLKCFSCKHETLVPKNALLSRPNVSPETRVLDIQTRSRCRQCNAWGEILISVNWI